jgi:hypothetical protein
MTTPPTPPGWYPDPSGAPGTRYWDGQRWGAAAPRPPEKNSALLIVGIVGGVVMVLFAGLIFLGVIGASLNKHDKSSAARVTDTGTPPRTPTAAPLPTIPAIGQEVRDGQFAFTVTSIDRSKTAGDLSNQFEIVPAQGEFLNVHMTVVNTGNHAQTFFATNQKLKISNRVYEANSQAALWTQSLNVTINPGNSIQAVVSFDVPPGTNGGTVQLHDSTFSGGAEVALS